MAFLFFCSSLPFCCSVPLPLVQLYAIENGNGNGKWVDKELHWKGCGVRRVREWQTAKEKANL